MLRLALLTAIFSISAQIGNSQNTEREIRTYVPFTKDGKSGCLSHTGEVVVPPNFEYSSCSGSRFVPVQREARFTLFDSQKGRTVDKVLYDYIEALDSNLFLAQNLSEVALFRGKRKFFEGKKTNFQLCPSKKYYAVKDGKSMRIFNMQNEKIGDFVADGFKIDGDFLQLISKIPINPLTQQEKDTIAISSIQHLKTKEKISNLLIDPFHAISDSVISVLLSDYNSYGLVNIHKKQISYLPWFKENLPLDILLTDYNPTDYRYIVDLDSWLVRTDKHLYLSSDFTDIVLLKKSSRNFDVIANVFSENGTVHIPFQGSLISVSPDVVDTIYVSDVVPQAIEFHSKTDSNLIYFRQKPSNSKLGYEFDFYSLNYKNGIVTQFKTFKNLGLSLHREKTNYLTYHEASGEFIYSLKSFKTIGKNTYRDLPKDGLYLNHSRSLIAEIDSVSRVENDDVEQPYRLFVDTTRISKTGEVNLNRYPTTLTYYGHDTLLYSTAARGPHYNVEVLVNGSWERITSKLEIGCGTQVFQEFITNGDRWHFTVPKFTGVISTKFRISMEIPMEKDGIIYSNEYWNAYNPGQIWRKIWGDP